MSIWKIFGWGDEASPVRDSYQRGMDFEEYVWEQIGRQYMDRQKVSRTSGRRADIWDPTTRTLHEIKDVGVLDRPLLRARAPAEN